MQPLRAVVALLKGETSSRSLETYRQRGERIYALLNRQPQSGRWAQPPGTEVARLCAWNALALQLFAERVQEADSRLDPLTEGYTPILVHGLLRRCYQTSIQWYEATLEARQDLTYLPPGKLPAGLPAWKGASHFSRPTLSALYEATLALRDQAQRRVADFAEAGGVEVSRKERGVPQGVQVFTFPQNHPQMLEALLRKQEQAKRKLIAAGSQLSHAEVGPNTWLELRLAAGNYFALGQLAAMPELIKTA